MAKTLFRIADLIEASRRSGQPVTLKFQPGMGAPLEECLVLVRYNKKEAK